MHYNAFIKYNEHGYNSNDLSAQSSGQAGQEQMRQEQGKDKQR